MDNKAKNVLVDIDPKLKQKMRETLDQLAHHLLRKKPEDPVNFAILSYFIIDSVYGPVLARLERMRKTTLDNRRKIGAWVTEKICGRAQS